MNFTADLLGEVLKTSLSAGGDFGDIFIEETAETALRLEGGVIRDVRTGTVFGAGIRVAVNGAAIYMYLSNPTDASLMNMAQEISEAVSSGAAGEFCSLEEKSTPQINAVEVFPDSADLETKLEYLQRCDQAGREYSSKVTDVIVRYLDTDQKVIIASSDGGIIKDRRIRTRMSAMASARQGGRRQTGFFGAGRSMGLEFFDLVTPESIGTEASRIACVLLDADYAPQGTYPVILANQFGGVIFHEACGHALESGPVAKGASPFSGKLGKKIASAQVTAWDDGTIAGQWGSSKTDDEGTPMGRTKLIHRGKLQSFIADRMGSMKLDHPLTGNGRRESYRFPPAARMTNTFIDAGKHTLDDLISSLEQGIYCRTMGGGSVDTTTTDFNFSVHEAYLVKNGAVDRPIQGASLIGKGTEVLKRIEMVGNDLDFGAGMCGSLSGSLPAAVGQPSILVSSLLIGGRT